MEALILTVIGTVLGTVLAAEARGWTRHVSRRMLRTAMARLLETWPDDARARWSEEIEADFATYADRPLGGLAFSLALRWAAFKPELARFSPRRRLTAFLDRWEQMSEEEREEAWERFSIALSSSRAIPGGAARVHVERRQRWRERERRAAARRRAELAAESAESEPGAGC